MNWTLKLWLMRLGTPFVVLLELWFVRMCHGEWLGVLFAVLAISMTVIMLIEWVVLQSAHPGVRRFWWPAMLWLFGKNRHNHRNFY